VLAPLLKAVVFNADAVRANLSRDLGFSHADRIEHARRMGWMCDRVVEAGGTVTSLLPATWCSGQRQVSPPTSISRRSTAATASRSAARRLSISAVFP
jgi:hypothetical protein